MLIKVSTGEYIDRISILRVKLEKIKDDIKLENIKREYDSLMRRWDTDLSVFDEHDAISFLLYDLVVLNRKLWEIEDLIREKEFKKEFDEDFIKYARSVYQLNDDRSDKKRQINTLTRSTIIEEKQYFNY